MALINKNIVIGCDPEFFFAKKGKIIGAEKIIPKEGIKCASASYYSSGTGKVIIDGVQAELNPRPNSCRANLAAEISTCFKAVANKLNDDIECSFAGVVNVSKKEFDTLSEKSKEFGCAPDINIYKKHTNTVKVNPKVYRKRSAGGHIHLGVDYYDVVDNYNNNKTSLFAPKQLNIHDIKDKENIIDERIKSFLHNKPTCYLKLQSTAKALQQIDRIVPMLDIILGNTCVLLDRNPSAAERRKVYGKAGDYRLTNYGIEYRTLSNFWLQSYQLMSLVTGLARTAVMIIASTIDEGSRCKCEEEIFEVTNLKDIRKAINKNDFDLAMKNFKNIEPVLLANTPNVGRFPICRQTIDAFHHIVKKGIDNYFKENPVTHWANLPDGHGHGWESFAEKIKRTELENLNQ